MVEHKKILYFQKVLILSSSITFILTSTMASWLEVIKWPIKMKATFLDWLRSSTFPKLVTDLNTLGPRVGRTHGILVPYVNHGVSGRKFRILLNPALVRDDAITISLALSTRASKTKSRHLELDMSSIRCQDVWIIFSTGTVEAVRRSIFPVSFLIDVIISKSDSK